MKNWSKKFLLVLCMVLLCAFTMASAEEAAEVVTFELPAETTTVQTGVAAETVTIALENAEGVWTLAGVAAGEAAGEAAEAEIPAGLVTVAASVEGTETVVDLAKVAVVSATETGLKLTVNANDVAAAMGEGYTVGDLKATTVTFEVGEVTTVKVVFDIVKAAAEETPAVEGEAAAEEETPAVEEPATAVIAYVDPDGILQSYRLTAKVGDPTPVYPEAIPTREGFEFGGWTNGWMGVNPVVKGDEVYEAVWLEYFTVTYFDWYDQKVLAEFVVLEGDPTPTIDPDRYTKASYVNMGFTTAIAPTVTGDVTYTMMQMVPPRENNVSGIKFVCSCPHNADHCKEIGYSGTVANYLRLDDISENVYFDGTNYKCVVYLGSDYSDFTTYYCNKVSSRVKNNHSFVSSDTTSFTVTFNMDTKRWVADQAEINVGFVCATAPVATDKTLNNIKIMVKGEIDGKVKTLGSLKVLDGSYTIGSVSGNATDGWTVDISVTNFDAHIAKWEAKYGVKAVVDTAATGNIVYTFTYTMPKDGLIATDGSGWVFQAPNNTVKLNGYTIWVTVVE